MVYWAGPKNQQDAEITNLQMMILLMEQTKMINFYLHFVFIATFFVKVKTEQLSINYGTAFEISDKLLRDLYSKKMKRVCYYAIPNSESWDKTLKNLKPADIDPHICTHIIIAFAKIENNSIVPKNSSDVDIYKEVLSLKSMNPNLKVMLSLNAGFSQLVKHKENVDLFAFNAAQFLRANELDGLDLDWEFPSWPFKITNWREKTQFTYLVMQLWNSLKLSSHPPFLLSIAVAAPPTIVKVSYEICKLAENLDFINLMGYDFRMYQTYFPFTGYNSPLHQGKLDVGYFTTLNVEWAANYWVSEGTPKEKLVVGIPTYGRTWKLLSFQWHKFGAPSVGPGMNGGYVSYPEALVFLKEEATRVFDSTTKVPYSFMGRNWVSYEDRESIYEKAKWIKNENFAGIMTWNLNCDDHLGTESERKFDLHKVIKEVLES